MTTETREPRREGTPEIAQALPPDAPATVPADLPPLPPYFPPAKPAADQGWQPRPADAGGLGTSPDVDRLLLDRLCSGSWAPDASARDRWTSATVARARSGFHSEAGATHESHATELEKHEPVVPRWTATGPDPAAEVEAERDERATGAASLGRSFTLEQEGAGDRGR